MVAQGPKRAFGLTCCTLTIVTGILIAMGFHRLEVNEVGIDYSANSLTLNTDLLYSNGLHFLGVGHSFIRFPRRQMELNMENRKAIRARTNDGLVVVLDTKILYSLDVKIDALASLYLMFKDDWSRPIENICRSVIRDVASEFTAYQFWAERSNVTFTMELKVQNRLDDIFVRLETFLLGGYTLPASFQSVIDVTEVQRQELNKVEYEMEQVDQSTQAIVLAANQQVLQIEVMGDATVREIDLFAEAEVFKINASVAQEVIGYLHMQKTLNMTNEELNTLVWLEKMNESPAAKIISVTTPTDMLLQ